MTTTDVYRDGKIHVQRKMCKTCIFRPGNLMMLQEGRVEDMVAEAGEDGCIPCHQNIHGDGGEAVCRGFFDKHRNSVLQIAARLGMIEEVDLESKSRSDDFERVAHDGPCSLCGSTPGEPHDVQAHDAWEDADDATWD